MRSPREPWSVLGALVAVQWAAVAAYALTVRHNGWLFYQGGDETWYHTSAWVLAHGHLPQSLVGWGWSYLLSPIALLGGSNYFATLPLVIVLQGVLLLPLALYCVYALAERIGGRLIGYWAAGAWVALPFVTIPLFDQRYHERYVEQFLPQVFGLTTQSDFPSMVCVLAAAVLLFRAMDERSVRSALLGGLAVGFAIGIKPANSLFLAAPLVALLLARRWREWLAFGVAVVPGLIVLTIWKDRGLGQIPVLSSAPELRLAAGAGVSSLSTLGLTDPIGRYVTLDWGQLNGSLQDLHEYFWSLRLLEWLPFAGLVAVARRSLPKAVFLGLWFAAFFIVKGTYSEASVGAGTLFRFLLPGFPAYFLLAASIPLLVPKLGPRVAERFRSRRGERAVRRGAIPVAAFLLAGIPLVLFLAFRPLPSDRTVASNPMQGTLIPVSSALAISTRPAAGGTRLAWSAPSTGSTRVFYQVFRSPTGGCDTPSHGAGECILHMRVIGTTRTPTWLDRPRGGGRWTYRIGLAANSRDDPRAGDVLLLSPPATVSSS